VTLGKADESKYTGEIHWNPVMKGYEYYWLIKIDDILLGDQSLGVCGSDGCRAAVDTGTSLLTAPCDDLFKLIEL
jgi:cathepsin D